MDKTQKFEQTQQIENYLEKHQVRELFLGLLKQTLVNRPDKPLDFLIDKLSNPQVKRVIILGAPGSDKSVIANEITANFPNFITIDVRDLLSAEHMKGLEYKDQVLAALKEGRFVDDDIVIEILKRKFAELEKHSAAKNWALIGFPKTKSQALSLGEMGFIPDKIFLLKNVQDQRNKVKSNIKTHIPVVTDKHIDDLITENELGQKGVTEVFQKYIMELDQESNAMFDNSRVVNSALGLHFNNASVRRMPNVMIVGPPGSGKSTQAKMLSYVYGLVNVSIEDLVQQKMKQNPELSKVIDSHIRSGNMVPDNIISTLVEQRLKQSDCQVNGWVLDGFPQTEAQVNLLRAMQIKPSHVILFDQEESESVSKCKNRKIDTSTGLKYNLKLLRCKDANLATALKTEATSQDSQTLAKMYKIPQESLQQLILDNKEADFITLEAIRRLSGSPEDQAAVVKNRYQIWKANMSALEEYFNEQMLTVNVQNQSKGQVLEQIENIMKQA